jgi:catechol 2,3-dioxygenase-like lactoylglutathione lyase family enzyme
MEVRSAHTRLFVDDIAACAQFYQDVLKFQPIALQIEKGYAEFEITANVRISLFRRQEMSEILRTSNLPVAEGAQDKVGLILNVHNLNDIYHELRQAGVAFAEPPTQNNEFSLKVAYFRDPAGTLIGLFEVMM